MLRYSNCIEFLMSGTTCQMLGYQLVRAWHFVRYLSKKYFQDCLTRFVENHLFIKNKQFILQYSQTIFDLLKDLYL